MDFLYISPEFPPNYANFVAALNDAGVAVWGIGEADFYEMPERLRTALCWYVRTNLQDNAAVQQALERLVAAKTALGRSGGFDVAESHNEQWLRLEGWINETFGIDGIRSGDLDRLKKKSCMKSVFRLCGLPTAEGEPVESTQHAVALAGRLGYPVILKPDEGVGASGIHKVESEAQLRRLLEKPAADYLLEAFIDGRIVTFDGLTDRSGEVVFESSLVYGDGVLDCVLGKETFFFLRRRIPEALAALGRNLVKAFDIRRKFFHFEFFEVDGRYLPIEINCRPPGGSILDMMNYSADVDLYRAYALMINGQRPLLPAEKIYAVGYVGRRDRSYRHDLSAIHESLGSRLVEHAENPLLYREAMGHQRFIFRTETEDAILPIAAMLLQTP
jgi:hypothetical protein